MDQTPTRSGETTPDLAALLARLDALERRLVALELEAADAAESLLNEERPRAELVSPTLQHLPAPAPSPWYATTSAATVPAVGQADAEHEPRGSGAPGPAWEPVPRGSGASGPAWKPGAEVPSDLEPGTPRWSILDGLSAGRLLAVAGGIAVVLGAVFFLSLAFSEGWIDERVRVGLGLLGGLVLLALGPVTFDRRQPTLAHVLVAAGIATLELSLYAARLYDLLPTEGALAGTLVVAALATVIAVRFDSQAVAALGLLAVLIAPPLMEAPADLTTALFLAIVLVATTAVSLARGWRWLPWLALLLTAPQLLTWLWSGTEPPVVSLLAVTGYWLVFAVAAAGEAWLRPPVRLRGSSMFLLMTDALVVVIVGTEAMGDRGLLGSWLIALAAIHAGFAAWFLVRRRPSDDHGQLLAALAIALSVPGILLAVPDVLVPACLAAEAVVASWMLLRFGHWYARTAVLALTAIGAGFLATAVYPVLELLGSGVFPPLDAGLLTVEESALVVGSVLAVLAAGALLLPGGWRVRSWLGAVAAVLLAYAAPFEVPGLALLLAWTLVAVIATIVASWGLRDGLRRGSAPPDPLLATGVLVGAVAVAWSVLGFAWPTGAVDAASAVFVERAQASLVPLAGLVVLTIWLRSRWWRGVAAGLTVLLATVATWVQFGGATILVPTLDTSVDGTLLALIAWAALGVVALVLDDRPRLGLRESSTDDPAGDPAGHPLALSAIVPAACAIILLAGRFLAPGMDAPLPTTPFVDEMTLATAIVVGALLLAAALARGRLVRSVTLGLSVVLVAMLLPLQIPLAWAVVGWAVLAVATMWWARSSEGLEDTGAWLVAWGLLVAGSAAVLLHLGPPDRLFLEATRVPPTSGPPNDATIGMLGLALGWAAAAWLMPRPEVRRWLWVAAGATGVYLLSIGVADLFAMRVADGAPLAETAKQAQVALSILWAGLGLATLAAGLVTDRALARQAGLVLLTIATVKVFLYDLAALDIAYRVLSLIGLGTLLLVGAWAYQHARHRGGPQAMGH